MDEVKLIEIEVGRFRVLRPPKPMARSQLPAPHVISDTMEPVEQVDGRFYTSKREYRAVGRAHGLTEVGTEKFKPKRRSTDTADVRQARRQAIKESFEKVRAGHRPHTAP